MPPKALPMFPQAAKTALANSQLRHNLGQATTTIRAKRSVAVGELPDWQALCSAGSAIKAEVMRHLDAYLLQFEAAVHHAGGQIHWARDASEANRIIVEIVQAADADRVVKVKSLTTDEIHLNDALAMAGDAIQASSRDFGDEAMAAHFDDEA